MLHSQTLSNIHYIFFILFLFSLLFLTHFVHLSPSQILLLLLHLMNLFLFFQTSLIHFFSFISLMNVLFCSLFLSLSFLSHSLIILLFFFCFFWGCILRRTANIWAKERYSLPQSNAVCRPASCLYLFSSWLIKLTPKIH